MKYLILIILLGAAFYVGRGSRDRANAENEIERISQKEFVEYQNINDPEDKLAAANQILAKVMQIFIADLGLRSFRQDECRIRSEVVESSGTANIREHKYAGKRESRLGTISQSNIKGPSETTSEPHRTDDKKSATTKASIIDPEKSKGAVHALYQAVLWRAPDAGGGAEATARFSEKGWHEYINNSRSMVQSSEFLRDVEPNHTSQEIINHMYAVYFGRCAFKKEMEARLENLKNDGPARVIATIISTSRSKFAEQIFSGGFPPTSCQN